MPLWLGISMAIWLVAASSIGLTFFLNYAKFDSTFADLEQSRFNVLAQSLSQSVENGLGLGLQLSELRNTQEIVDRISAENAAVTSLSVFNARGERLFGSGAVLADGQSVYRDGLTAFVGRERAAEDVSYWAGEDADAFGVGRPLINPFDQIVGGVYLRYEKANSLEVSRQAFERLGLVSVVVIIGLTLIVTPIVSFLLAKVTKRVRRMTAYARAELRAELVDPSLGAESAGESGSPPDEDLALFVSEANALNDKLYSIDSQLENKK